MFDFQKLVVYQKAKAYNVEIKHFLSQGNFDRYTHSQLRRASFSIMLNIAEGNSRFSNKDKRNFMVISRGSAFECVGVFDYLLATGEINQEKYDYFHAKLEELSKMLYAIIKSLE
ncbi:MAG TPA: four helix bundle protein [Bacteroidales bacterium]|nr:four helix bundle protein [Bacteroidales bacterium]